MCDSLMIEPVLNGYPSGIEIFISFDEEGCSIIGCGEGCDLRLSSKTIGQNNFRIIDGLGEGLRIFNDCGSAEIVVGDSCIAQGESAEIFDSNVICVEDFSFIVHVS